MNLSENAEVQKLKVICLVNSILKYLIIRTHWELDSEELEIIFCSNWILNLQLRLLSKDKELKVETKVMSIDPKWMIKSFKPIYIKKIWKSAILYLN